MLPRTTFKPLLLVIRAGAFARNDLDLGNGHYIVSLHLEARVGDNKGPDIVKVTVGLKMAFERGLALDGLAQNVAERPVVLV